MSKIRCYVGNGHYEYIKHCPFCGSVHVDFDYKTFNCPDCGAVVTFNLSKDDHPYCDGPTESEKVVSRWNKRAGKETTADDLCILAQKAEKETRLVYQDYIEREVWSYIVKAATLGKFSCDIPAKYFKNREEYERKKFDIEDKGDYYVVSWQKGIEWDE